MRRIIPVIALSVLFLIGAAHAEESAHGLDLLLRCDGIGTRIDTQTATMSASNSAGQTATANSTTYSKERFNDRLLLDLKMDGGRIRMPKSMVPPINSGGSDGWWSLTDLQVSEDAILARFKMNFLNKPVVRIDRSTGDIEVSGFAGLNFRGSCERLDRAERKF
jgi:hypothetical protein